MEKTKQVRAGQLKKSVDQRAYHNSGDIYVADGESIDVILHETGHSIEYEGGNETARAFLRTRIRGREHKIVQFNKHFPGTGYKDYEVGWVDAFDDAMMATRHHTLEGADRVASAKRGSAYTGKFYTSGSTEVTSMGVEGMYRNAEALAKADPEFFDYILGMLEGTILP